MTTILERIDELSPDELVRGVYQILYSGTADRGTHEKMKDPRLVPIMAAIVRSKGRPAFPPLEELPGNRPEQVVLGALQLLAETIGPEDREAVATIIAALDDENVRIQLAAAVALGRVGTREAAAKVVALTEQMMEHGEMGAVARLAPVLAAIGDEQARACLAGFISRKGAAGDKHVQHAVAAAKGAAASLRERLEREER